MRGYYVPAIFCLIAARNRLPMCFSVYVCTYGIKTSDYLGSKMMLQTALKEGTCLIRSANICSWSLAAACADSFRWRMGKALRLLESNSGRNSGDFGLYFAEVGGALFAVDEPMNVVRTRTRKKKKLKRS